jgi:hypothetical protein
MVLIPGHGTVNERTLRMQTTTLALLLLGLCASLSGRAATRAAPAHVIFDERGYVRSYVQFDWDRLSPGPLKQAVDRKHLTRNEVRRIERLTKRRLAHLDIDWDQVDWRDRAVVRFVCSNAGIRPAPKAERFMNAPSPPANWAGLDFDDSPWPRQRRPFLLGRPNLGTGVQNSGVRAVFFRARFFIPQPEKAGDLTLDLAYRGGVRVFVNGDEIARGHLPPGEVDPTTYPEAYPYEAYVRVGDEITDRTRELLEKYERRRGRWPARGLYVPELFGRFDNAPHPRNQPDVALCHRRTTSVTRAIWNRIQRLRDRRLENVRIPAKLLRKGANVLAIEARASQIHPIVCREGQAWVGWGNFSWPHVQVNAVALRGPLTVPSAVRRPTGTQVWVADVHHRVHDTEWGPPGDASRPVRFVGARNGRYAAQVVVGTDRALRRLRVSTAPLEGADGAALPAPVARPMRPRPLGDLTGLLGGRSKTATDPLAGGLWSLRQYGLADVESLTREQKIEALKTVRFFDHIPAAGPVTVPADTCQAVWLRLRIPPDAPAGPYRGTVKIEADGMRSRSVPVEAEVVDWALPDPREFRTLMALEQSPYGVAKQYDVKPWSEAHLRRLGPSIQLLGRAGNDWLFVPVLTHTEFGNRTDSPVRWVRGKDGRLGFDYTNLDRYLDLAIRHWGTPRVISFVVMHGNPKNPPEVMVYDEASGKAEPMRVAGPDLTEAQRRAIWGPFAVDLYRHMKKRGLHRSMFWGYAWDSEGDPTLKYLLAEFAPEVPWSMGGHALRTHPRFYLAFSWIYKVHSALSLAANERGWANPKLEFLNPRGGGSVLCLPGNAPPFGFRLAVDRALTAGTRGLARIGTDYWSGAYYDGTRGGEVYLQPGMPVHALFWPGPEGAETSGRYEALVEGIQEAEARIFLEEAAGRGLLPPDLARRARDAVERHIRSTIFIPAGVTATRFLQYGAAGWQDRSRRLYRTAAEVARAVGLDVDRLDVRIDVPARGTRQVRLTLRNWTGTPRAWTTSTQADWIQPAKTAGTTSGTEELVVVIDARRLKPGSVSQGELVVTDAGAKRRYPVAIRANVPPVLECSLESLVFNVPVGKDDRRTFTLFNRSAKPLKWRAGATRPWLTVTPSRGALGPGAARLLTARAAPDDRAAARHEATLTLTEADGADAAVGVLALVVPPYRAPKAKPRGARVALRDVEARRLVRHGILAHDIDLGRSDWLRENDKNKPRFAESMYYGWHLGRATLKGWKKSYAEGLWVRPHHETVYNVEGSGFTAFSADVGLPKEGDKPQLHRDARVCFEVYVDGALRAHSGLMKLGDQPRRLVVTGIEDAKQVRLVTRLDSLKDSPRSLFFWADPAFHRKAD